MSEYLNMYEYLQKSIENKVTDFKNPTCQNCNECCSIMAMITEKEYKELHQYLNNNFVGMGIYKNAVNRLRIFMQQGSLSFVCPFSNENKKCDIYSMRPSICRKFHCSPELNLADKTTYKQKYTIASFFYTQQGIMHDELKKFICDRITI